MKAHNGMKFISGRTARKDGANVYTFENGKNGFFEIVDSDGKKTRKIGPKQIASMFIDGQYNVFYGKI